MSEMIERVAEAIVCVQEGPCDPKIVARVAIEAMREPTDEMIDALPTVGLLPVSEQRDYVIRDWRKMIDAALLALTPAERNT